MSNLWQQITEPDSIQEAWHTVRSNAGSAGGDGVSTKEFKKNLYANLTQLRAELIGGTYRTGPFRKVSMPKKKGGYRVLTIPSIRDRVVHTSIAKALTPILDPLFEEGSFAYRPNRGVIHAVQKIENWRNRGFNVVIEADIVSYFDNIDQDILLEKLETILQHLEGAAPTLQLLRQLLKEQAKALGTPNQGVVQGSPLSPILANLYLDALDEEMDQEGVKIVRYADDFIILCKSRRKAERALQHVVTVIAKHNLELHDEGTRIVNFDQGFDFIGYLFLRSLALKKDVPNPQAVYKPTKSTITDEGIIELGDEGSRFDPGKRVLYVLDAGHKLQTRNKSFSVRRTDDTELISIPPNRIGRIEIGPFPAYTRHAIDLALHQGVDFAVIDRFGQTKGTLSALHSRKAKVHLRQAEAILDNAKRLEIARSLVRARIRNQRTQILRLNRARKQPLANNALKTLAQQQYKVNCQQTIEQLRGIEGAAAAVYWPTLGLFLNGFQGPFRRSRPAKDAPNAVINYLTAILERDTRAAIQSVGLHPGFGFLHASKDRHDGLVYDLMEPFRASLTEGLAVFLFNSGRLKLEMFLISQTGSVEMNDAAIHAIIKGYETAIARLIKKSDGPGRLSWRAMMRHQALSLSKAILNRSPTSFQPAEFQT